MSGLRAVTTRPTSLNSGLALQEIRVERQERKLLLELFTTPGGEGARSTSEPLRLGRVAPGRYLVQHREPDGTTVDLGTVLVPQ